MGVINVTPDSFSDGGLAFDPARALDAALAMEAAGADIIDIGAESTRPGAGTVDAGEEWARLEPVLASFAGRISLPVSVDTYKAVTAGRALSHGASIVNDISGLRYDPDLGPLVAERGAALVLMHTRGRSTDMYALAEYRDVVGEVAAELAWSLERAASAGVPADRLIVDPGLGFAKRAGHSLAVLAGLQGLAGLGRPILVGPSRKSFLGAATGTRTAADRDWATAAAVTAAVLGGAHIVRVHNVAAMIEVARAADAICRASAS